VLGLRHASTGTTSRRITDITSSTDVAEHAEETHELEHQSPAAHAHSHGGADEVASTARPTEPAAFSRPIPGAEIRRCAAPANPCWATLYAFGHGAVVIALGSMR
jgi:hypothetical protein